MDAAGIVVGAVVLLFGRHLFWVFVGIMGFLVGFDLASMYLAEQPRFIILAVALVVGILGVLAALFLQRIAFGIAGFLAGGYFLATSVAQLGWVTAAGYEVVFLFGGVIGALAVLLLTDWGLIILSSLIGAVMISDAFLLEPIWRTVIIVALTAVGIFVQSQLLQRQIPPRRVERQ